VVLLGTRPEAIKLLPVIQALRQETRLAVRVVMTGQHREMVDQILAPFGVIPDYDLDIMRPDQSLNDIVCRILPRLEKLYQDLAPRLVLVQGDTTSAFAAGLAAFHRRIALGHVEAGLRSFNRFHPYPEESNRRMLSCVTDVHFAATPGAKENLLREGVSRDDVVVTGNTVVDCLLGILARPDLLEAHRPADGIWNSDGNLVLITLHRRENWMGSAAGLPSPLEQVLGAVAQAAGEYPGTRFVYPVHRNPRVREPVQRVLGSRPNVHLLDPVSYLPFVDLMSRSTVILTDSGGIQEEAPSLGVPVLVARETTERPEGLECGSNRLVGTQPEVVLGELRRYLDRSPGQPRPRPCPNPFGDGQASGRIRQAILHRFGFGERPQEFRPGEAFGAASSRPTRGETVPKEEEHGRDSG
jgi:UDP-N-acetylglucosamine 2-epimerase (non-hydrolysing)